MLLLKNEKGMSKGSAIVEFSSVEEAEYALNKVNGEELEKRKIQIEGARKTGYQKPY